MYQVLSSHLEADIHAGYAFGWFYSKCNWRYHLSHNFQAYCTCMDNQIRWQLGLGREQITYMEGVII